MKFVRFLVSGEVLSRYDSTASPLADLVHNTEEAKKFTAHLHEMKLLSPQHVFLTPCAVNGIVEGNSVAGKQKAKELGARAIPLNVSAPFHCPLMQPAADEMAEALAAATIIAPRAPLVANVTARPVHEPEEIRRLLVEQVTGRVRWRESIAWLVESGGVTRFAEAGAGKVLSGMAKRIAPDAEASPLNTPADLEAFAKSL